MAPGDQAPADVTLEADDGVTDLHATADPAVLDVCGDAVDLDQHPEPPSVDLSARRQPPPGWQRCAGDQRRRPGQATVDPAPNRLDQSQGLAQILGHRLRPRPENDPRLERLGEEARRDLAAGSTSASTTRSAGKVETTAARRPARRSRLEPAEPLRVQHLVAAIDQEEPAVVPRALAPELDRRPR